MNLHNKYNKINSQLEEIINKRKLEIKPIIDTTLPFVKESEFIKYIAAALFTYKHMSKSGAVVNEEFKNSIRDQFTNQLNELKQSVTQLDSEIKELRVKDKELYNQLKTLTKEQDTQAQNILSKIEEMELKRGELIRKKSRFEDLIKHYLNKLSKLKNNDPKLMNYIAESLFIKNLISMTYNSESTAKMVELAKSDIEKIDKIAVEKNIAFPLALLSAITFNAEYRRIIASLESYTEIVSTLIGLEILSDYMNDIITDDEVSSDKYWKLPVINDILNKNEVNDYINVMQEKYDKVYKFYMSNPIYFKKGDLKHIKSILKYVYSEVLSPASILLTAQVLDEIKTTPLNNSDATIYLMIYNNLVSQLSNALFPNGDQEFLKKYIFLILLTTTTPEDLTARLEVM